MRGNVVIAFILIISVIISGCVQSASEDKQYVCPDGQTIVKNITNCPKTPTPMDYIDNIRYYYINDRLPNPVPSDTTFAPNFDFKDVQTVEWFPNVTSPFYEETVTGDIALVILQLKYIDQIDNFEKDLIENYILHSSSVPDVLDVDGIRVLRYKTDYNVVYLWKKDDFFFILGVKPERHFVIPEDIIREIMK